MLQIGLCMFTLMMKIRMIKIFLKLTITIPIQQWYRAQAV
jgi:hypothetical protein